MLVYLHQNRGMLMLIPIVVLKLAMLLGIGADYKLCVGIVCPELIVGSLVTLWSINHAFTPPEILVEGGTKRSTFQTTLAQVLRNHPLTATAPSIVISCSLWLNKIVEKVWFTII